MTSENTRPCSKCGLTLPLDRFYIRSNGGVNPWCKDCYRRWYLDRHKIKDPTLNVGDERICSHCGQPFALKQRKESTYCSRSCKDQARKAEAVAELLARKPARKCLYCDKTMPRSMRADARFCSEGCNSAAHQITRKMAKRADTDRPDELLSRAYIANRDKWICGICGTRVSRTKRHPDPGAGSIDHIVPLAMGGTNDLSNLQLAHFQCNWAKRQHGGGQMRLLG